MTQHKSVLFVAPLMMYVLWLLRVRVARRPADLVMLVSLFIAALLPCVRACAAVHKVGEGLRVGAWLTQGTWFCPRARSSRRAAVPGVTSRHQSGSSVICAGRIMVKARAVERAPRVLGLYSRLRGAAPAARA